MRPVPPKFLYLLSALAVLTVCWVWRTGPLHGYDTVSFLHHAANREPLFPLLLGFSGSLFGPGADLFVMLFQTLLVLAACFYFSCTLYALYFLPGPGLLLCSLLVISPLFLLGIGNLILSEALAYSMFLFSAAWAARAVKLKTFKALLFCLLFAALCALVRPQLSVLYLLYACVAAYLAFGERSRRGAVLSALALAAAVAAVGLLKCSYHAYFNRAFQGTASSGLYLAAGALYISDSSDLELFRGEKYYPLMRSVYAQMDKDRLFSMYRHAADQDLAAYFGAARGPDRPYMNRMVVIYWYVLAKKIYLYLEKGDAAAQWEEDLNGTVLERSFDADGKRWNEMDMIGRDIFRKITARRLTDYLKFQGSLFRSHSNLMELGFYLLFCLLFLLRNNELNFLISSFSLFNLVHLTLVGCTGSYIPRTVFYSFVLQGVCLLLFAVQYRAPRANGVRGGPLRVRGGEPCR